MSARSASQAAPGGMSETPLTGSSFLGWCRKLLIVAIFAVVLGRVVLLNVGVSLEKLGVRDLASQMTQPVPSLDALLLRQQWSLLPTSRPSTTPRILKSY